ncbi:hypothetical protein ABGB12_11550 [Actinocorallia sp. B10E7]|uniref:hypothetical protein n=1 Tax=Actinocorallia sp. B10E7 TaxID=3153558 RepID=UPI00325DF66C
MLKRTAAVLVAAASVLGATAVAPAAHAGGYGCAGRLVKTIPVPLKDLLTGKTYYRSDVKLYYNPKSGWNCAVMVKRPGKPRYNAKVPMYLEIKNARWAEDRQKNNIDRDQGDFRRYAGPVKVNGRWKGRGLCISVIAFYSDAEANGQDSGWNGRLYKSRLACR